MNMWEHGGAGASEGGASAEEAVRSVISEESTWQEVDAVREATWQSFAQAWQGGDTSTLSYMLGQSAVDGPESAGENYLPALAGGASAQDAGQLTEQAHFQSILGGRGSFNQQGYLTTNFEFDWLGNSLWIQGFDPSLQARARIQEAFNELRTFQALSEGTISAFDEIITGTTGDDNF